MNCANNLIVIFLIGLILSACSGSNSAAKDRVYSDEKLIAVMVDLYTAQAAIKDVKEDLVDSLSNLYRSQIEKIHKVEMGQIEKDLLIVQGDLRTYTDIHTSVQDSIVLIEKRLAGKKKTPTFTKPKGAPVQKILGQEK